MRSFLRKKLAKLAGCTSGNATMIVALGMPVLIGGTGFAVDTAQWYLWKGELQYAVDQAAIAGAWARTKDATEESYDERAAQEYATNIAVVEDFTSAPTVTLENWATGTQNSVVVTASASKELPFSFFLTGDVTRVTVRAQAAFEKGINAPACLVAVDEHAEGAITIGGSAEFIAGCGIKALSDAGKERQGKDCDPDTMDPADATICNKFAIRVNGNPKIHAGTLMTEGAIDDWFDVESTNNIDNEPLPFQDTLTDNFADLEPPNPPQSQVSRTYSCPAKNSSTTTAYNAALVTTHKLIEYTYWKKSGNSYTSYNYTGSEKKTNVDTTTTDTNVALATLPAGLTEASLPGNASVTEGPTASGYVQVDSEGNGASNKIYEKSVTTLEIDYEDVTSLAAETQGDAAILQPGTYTDLKLSCDTVFTSGVYILSGGTLEIHSKYNVTGNGVMFVLTDGAGIVINGGANVNLTAMTVSQLQAAGVDYDDAVQLDGMLIFEDRESEDANGNPGNAGNKINGNASTILNGTIYLPVSNLDIRGSAGVTSQCLLLVASTITISGNVEMESFCPADKEQHAQDTQLPSTVRLVS